MDIVTLRGGAGLRRGRLRGSGDRSAGLRGGAGLRGTLRRGLGSIGENAAEGLVVGRDVALVADGVANTIGAGPTAEVDGVGVLSGAVKAAGTAVGGVRLEVDLAAGAVDGVAVAVASNASRDGANALDALVGLNVGEVAVVGGGATIAAAHGVRLATVGAVTIAVVPLNLISVENAGGNLALVAVDARVSVDVLPASNIAASVGGNIESGVAARVDGLATIILQTIAVVVELVLRIGGASADNAHVGIEVALSSLDEVARIKVSAVSIDRAAAGGAGTNSAVVSAGGRSADLVTVAIEKVLSIVELDSGHKGGSGESLDCTTIVVVVPVDIDSEVTHRTSDAGGSGGTRIAEIAAVNGVNKLVRGLAAIKG